MELDGVYETMPKKVAIEKKKQQEKLAYNLEGIEGYSDWCGKLKHGRSESNAKYSKRIRQYLPCKIKVLEHQKKPQRHCKGQSEAQLFQASMALLHKNCSQIRCHAHNTQEYEISYPEPKIEVTIGGKHHQIPVSCRNIPVY